MYQTAHHCRNWAFYTLVNEAILGKLFFDPLIFAAFLIFRYLLGFLQNFVVGLVCRFEIVVQR